MISFLVLLTGVTAGLFWPGTRLRKRRRYRNPLAGGAHSHRRIQTATPIPLEAPRTAGKIAAGRPPEPSTKGARSEQEVSAQGTVYTWEDGDRTLTVVLQRDLVVQETAANTPEDVVVAGGARDSIVQKQPEPGQDARPVFRSESGGGLMTLPGGVLLALDPEWDEAGVESFFSRNNISKDRPHEPGSQGGR